MNLYLDSASEAKSRKRSEGGTATVAETSKKGSVSEQQSRKRGRSDGGEPRNAPEASSKKSKLFLLRILLQYIMR